MTAPIFTSCRRSFWMTRGLPRSTCSSSSVSSIVPPSAEVGQRNRPFSSLLKYSQKPSPSHSNIFSLSRARLQNTNNVLLNGSSPKLPSTIAAKPLICLRISVCPHARYTAFPSNFNIAASEPGRPFPTALVIHRLPCSRGVDQFRLSSVRPFAWPPLRISPSRSG